MRTKKAGRRGGAPRKPKATFIPDVVVPPHVNHKRRIYTNAETRAHMHFVEQLYLRGTSNAGMVALAKQELGVGPKRVQVMLERIKEAWKTEDEENRKSAKGATIRRIQRYIQDAQGRKDPNDPKRWIEKPNFAALARFEALLADIQGTREPITIDLNVRIQETVLNVIADLSAEELTELVGEYDETMKLAEAARKGLVIDTTGTPVEAPRMAG